MKKLVIRLGLLIGCALPLVLTAGTGTAGAGEVVVIVAGTRLTVTVPDCLVGPGCVLTGQPNICIGAGEGTTFGMAGCTAIGD